MCPKPHFFCFGRAGFLVLLALALILWLGGGISPTAAQQPPDETSPENSITLAEYRALVAESHTLVQRDDALTEFGALATRWEKITAVRHTHPDGTPLILPVSHTYLVSLLRADIPNFGRLRHTFAALEQAAAGWPIATEPLTPAEFAPQLTTLDDLLARPEFTATPNDPNFF